MLDDLIAAYGNRFLLAALGVSLALVCLFVVLWLLRHRAPSPFVRGGRNRQPRLQVLDAAAIDARRRLVLVRRDNVEHLVMIGGPTDIVIESGIGDERTYISVPEAPQERLPREAEPPRALAEQRDVAVPAPPPAASEVQAPAPARALHAPAEPPPAAVISATSQDVSPGQPARSTVPAPETPQPPAVARQQEMPPALLAAVAAVRPEPAPAAPEPSDFEPLAAVDERAPVVDLVPARAEAPGAAADARASSPVAPEVEPARQPAPSVALAAPAPAPARLEEQPRVDVAPAPAPAGHRVETPRPSAERRPEAPRPQRPAAPVSGNLNDIFDAARERVLARRQPEETPPAPQAPRPAPAPPLAPGAAAPSEFERLLEAEMTSHLAATVPPQPSRPAAPSVLPPRPAVAPPVVLAQPRAGDRPASASAPAGAPQAEEPSLQKEIARIFGEMSAKRDD